MKSAEKNPKKNRVNTDNKRCDQWLASDNVLRQICGAILKRWWWVVLFVISLIPYIVLLCYGVNAGGYPYCPSFWTKFCGLASITFLVLAVISICNILTDVFCLLRKENHITNCQIIILIAIGVGIIGVIFVLHVTKDSTLAIALSAVGAALAWIFQDRIKGAFTFIHFRWNKLLNIEDWIQIPKLGVDGEIKKVTLTTVTISNWDTTTSSIPISALESEHFINLQNMSKGKTYGRRMKTEFTIDTSWIHPVEKTELTSILSHQCEDKTIQDYLPIEEVKEGTLNIHLYRLYLYHWLMAHSHVSQQPRLLVRWMEHKESGMVLQVYAFLTDHNFSAFEWEKSKIIEHIITSMAWFGLRLYQSPSAYDAGNINVCMAKKPATYKIEEK